MEIKARMTSEGHTPAWVVGLFSEEPVDCIHWRRDRKRQPTTVQRRSTSSRIPQGWAALVFGPRDDGAREGES